MLEDIVEGPVLVRRRDCDVVRERDEALPGAIPEVGVKLRLPVVDVLDVGSQLFESQSGRPILGPQHVQIGHDRWPKRRTAGNARVEGASLSAVSRLDSLGVPRSVQDPLEVAGFSHRDSRDDLGPSTSTTTRVMLSRPPASRASDRRDSAACATFPARRESAITGRAT